VKDLMISFLDVLIQSAIIVQSQVHVVVPNLNPHAMTRMVHGIGIGIVAVVVVVAVAVVAAAAVAVVIDPVVYSLGVAHHVANLT